MKKEPAPFLLEYASGRTAGVAEKFADGGTGDGNYRAQYFEAAAGLRDYGSGENGG